MFTDDPIFSGQETQGFVLFPALHDDVTEITVTIEDVVLRFNYADQPVETVDLAFRYDREVFRGYQPPPQPIRTVAAFAPSLSLPDGYRANASR